MLKLQNFRTEPNILACRSSTEIQFLNQPLPTVSFQSSLSRLSQLSLSIVSTNRLFRSPRLDAACASECSPTAVCSDQHLNGLRSSEQFANQFAISFSSPPVRRTKTDSPASINVRFQCAVFNLEIYKLRNAAFLLPIIIIITV